MKSGLLSISSFDKKNILEFSNLESLDINFNKISGFNPSQSLSTNIDAGMLCLISSRAINPSS